MYYKLRNYYKLQRNSGVYNVLMRHDKNVSVFNGITCTFILGYTEKNQFKNQKN